MTDAIRQVFYSADLIIPNGSDVSPMGDGCEEGSGADLVSGWYDADWCRTEVQEEQENVRPDVWDADVDPSVWLAYTLNQRLAGWPEYNDRQTWYAGEADQSDYETGISVSVAAHAEGFTDTELAHTEDLLQMVRKDYGFMILEGLYSGDLQSRQAWAEWNEES
jgi:hypothetical protein